MRLCRPLAVALGGLALSVLTMGPAAAAHGTFVWVGPKGKAYAIQNPPDRKCLGMAQEARGPQNATKKALVVYAKPKCKGASHRLAPGHSASGSVHFASVIFNPR
ncbi:hypothetical protein [Streptomyces arenae]|uniref:hypothetical protein n=1 Tax=Streptomyces arenae TaxID=29301 RepID=UPI002658B650|nr:hypothetical protein [Streptomyces arenae]MCG7208370.1 hypothetical protein [Streptomyces arenae]